MFYQLAWLGDNEKQEDKRGPFMTLNCPRIWIWRKPDESYLLPLWIWRKPDESYLLPQNMDKMLVFNIYYE